MTRRTVAGLVLAGILVVAVLAVVLFTRDSSPTARENEPEIETRLAISPRVVLFGDTVTARVGVALDRTRIDPASLRISTNFAPWSPVGAPRSTRRDGETTSYLETTYVLRCLALACVPRRTAATREFEPVGVSFTRRGGEQGSLSRVGPCS